MASARKTEKKNIAFMDLYKTVDGSIKDRLGSSEGVSEYIRRMDAAGDCSSKVDVWKQDYRMLKHLRWAHGARVDMECSQRIFKLKVILLALVLLPRNVLKRYVPLVQSQTADYKVCRLVDVEDYAVCELLARRLDETQPRKAIDRAIRNHERSCYKRLDAVPRHEIARAGIDGVDVREEEVPSRGDVGVVIYQFGKIACLQISNDRLDSIGAPLVRIGEHRGLARLPEPTDEATVRANALPDRGENEI